jgi:hypothetical protein
VHSLANLFGAGHAPVVWRDEELGRNAMRGFQLSALPESFYGPTQTLVADANGQLSSTKYTQPAISRCAVAATLAGVSRQVVVAKASTNGLFPGTKLRAFLLGAPSTGSV